MYVKLRRLQWAGHVVKMDDKRTRKSVLMESKSQKAVQEKDGKMLSLWMQERCWECDDGSPSLLIQRGGESG